MKIVEENLFGNKSFKEEFLNLIEDNYTIIENGETKDSMLKKYYTAFGKRQLGQFENIYGKDIYNFTKNELLDAYATLGFSDISSIRSLNSVVKKYIDYAYNKVDVKVITPATSLIVEDDLYKCLSQLKRDSKYMTEKELYESLEYMLNELDQCMVMSLWEGIKGDKFTELINLQKDDFNYEQSYIQVGNRKIKLNEIQREIFSAAINQTEYKKMIKGEKKLAKISDDNNKQSLLYNTYPMYESEYIFRNIVYKGKIAKTPILDDMAIKNRITEIKKQIDRRHWTAVTIYVSGVVYRMLQIRRDWNLKSTREYLELYSINMNPYNALSIMEILIKKIDSEKQE
jgi:hypothetical protein